jgi:NADH-quinone oxidoreductase subunit H
MKEEIIPTSSNKALFVLGPGLAMTAALMTCSVIPWSSHIEIFDRKVDLQIADINIGILYIFGVVSMGVYGMMIGGWASNNKFSLMAALRGASQAISYELAMGLSLIAVLMLSGSLSLKTIVDGQMAAGGYWNIVYQPLGFIIFFVCALAECNRTPFDLPEAEAELVSGYNVEYGAMGFAMFSLGEYANMLTMSALCSILFLGGWLSPTNDFIFLIGSFWFGCKICFFVLLYVLMRAILPRYRYDQLMDIGWKMFLPISICYLMLTSAIMISFNILPF